MAETIVQGPLVSGGSLINNSVSPTDGPEIQYQGSIFPDPRYSPMAKDGLAPGRVKGFPLAPAVTVVDAIPSANSTGAIVASVVPSTVAGIALTLVTAQAGTAAGVTVFAPGVPIIPLGTTKVVTVGAIDFGFATGTTVANSTTVIVNDNSLFSVGQWVIIPGVNGTTTAALFTQVQMVSASNTTIITVSPAPLTALSHVPIGQANLYGNLTPPASQFGPSAVVPTGAEPYRLAGFGLAFDPLQGVARCLQVSAASTGSGTTSIFVTGYDVFGVLMTETIGPTAGTTAIYGKKAFKYIASVNSTGTPATTVTPAAINVGVSDLFGLPLRADKWEYLNINWNGCSAPTSAGFTAALVTTSTQTTIDVRGTVNASTLNVATVASTNGARRLTIIQYPALTNMLNSGPASPLGTAALFGTPQV